MDLSAYYAVRELVGELDARTLPSQAQLYLLDGNFCILSQRTEEAEHPLLGSFFKVYPAAREEREEIAAFAHGFGHEALLACCCGVPVLFLCSLFLKTGLLLAAVPQGEVREILSFPCSFSGTLRGLTLTHGALARYKEQTSEDFEKGCQWYLALSRVLTYKGAVGVGEVDVAALGRRAVQLAKLTGTQLQFDFTGLGTRCNDALDVEWFTGVLLAAFFCARQLSAQRGVHLIAERSYPHQLVLKLSFACDSADAPLPAFSVLQLRASARGVLLQIEHSALEREEVRVCTCLSCVELSAQGSKEQHPILFDSPLLTPSPIELPGSVTDMHELFSDET